MKTPVNVAITGAAGQIGYALAFRVASGQMLGPDQPVNLQLLEITAALPALSGVVMELNDCAFPTLAAVQIGDDATKVFDGVKKLGATVVGASDETQLNSQLEFILQKKILLEDEEPPKKK